MEYYRRGVGHKIFCYWLVWARSWGCVMFHVCDKCYLREHCEPSESTHMGAFMQDRSRKSLQKHLMLYFDSF